MDPTTAFGFEERARKLEAEMKRLAEETAELKSGRPPKEPKSERLVELQKENAKLKYQLQHLQRNAESSSAASVPAVPSSVTVSCDEDKGIVLQQAVTAIFSNAIARAYPDITGVQTNVKLTVGKNRKAALYQCDAALPLVGQLKRRGVKASPRDVANNLLAALPENDIVASATIAGPGFININLQPAFVAVHASKILAQGVLPPMGVRPLRAVVDLSSPNIAKEMHVGHLRSTIIGDSIARVLEYVGHDVVRVNHVGDWGTQFGMLIAHLKDEFPNFSTEVPPISDLQSFYKASKARFDSDAEFKKRAYQEVVSLQSGQDPDVTKAWNLICDVSRREFNRIYERLDVKLEEKGESFYQKMMDGVVSTLTDAGMIEDDETAPGRKIIWTTAKDKVGIPLIVVKSDGGYTYDTSDLATMKYRLEEEKGDWLVYVVDNGQAGHFQNVFACAETAGWWNSKTTRVDHVGFGVVLGEDGKKFKTRSGASVRLKDLLDTGVSRAREYLVKRTEETGQASELTAEEQETVFEAVAYGCIKYTDLSHDRTMDYKFSYEKMLNDKGNTAVYLLYAYARMRAILRNPDIAAFGVDLDAKRSGHVFTVEHPSEMRLAQHLLVFPEVINTMLGDLQPRNICTYLYDLCGVFTEFYSDCYCVVKDKETGKVKDVHVNRLLLVEAASVVLAKGLELLGLRKLERM